MDAAGLDLFDLTPDPAVLLAPDGSRLRANAAFRALFPHALYGVRPPWGRAQPPDFVDGERVFEASAPDGRRYEWRERRLADGARIASARDVTTRVQAAEQAARARTTLFATLTHELRTPLNGILGMYEVLSQTRLDPAERAYLQAIRTSGEHLLGLITDILDYARLDAESATLEECAFDPEEMVQAAAELLSPRAYEKGLDVCVRVAGDVPARLAGDARRLRQILFNLAGNALKFTAEGGVALEVSMAGGGAAPKAAIGAGWAGQGRARVRFTVRDTGPGVPREMQMRIFEEFVQADSSHARRFGGAGLGLAIVKKLAGLLGGAAGVESAPGRGSSFWVDLPFQIAAPARAPERVLEGVSVLVAAPSPLLAAVTAETIIAHGGRAETAADRAQLDKAPAPDVLILDHAIAQGAPAPFLARGAAIIVLVPQEERAALALYREAGIGHYLVKPVRRASLIERVRLAAGRAPAGSDVTPPGAGLEDERAAPAGPPRPGARVLLAEDNPVNALIARTLLTRAGCAVEVVGDGAAAVAAVAAGGHDLVFLDLRMPVMDGRAAARLIRALPGPPARTPLIALTAEAGEDERAEALAAGMDDFLTKPIVAEQLSRMLARFTPAVKTATA